MSSKDTWKALTQPIQMLCTNCEHKPVCWDLGGNGCEWKRKSSVGTDFGYRWKWDTVTK